MNSANLEILIKNVDRKLRPLLEEKERLRERLEVVRSQEFIHANRITKDQVQQSTGSHLNLPWFGNIHTFALWCENNTNKPWCCWNDLLYRTEDLKKGLWNNVAVGRYEDLP